MSPLCLRVSSCRRRGAVHAPCRAAARRPVQLPRSPGTGLVCTFHGNGYVQQPQSVFLHDSVLLTSTTSSTEAEWPPTHPPRPEGTRAGIATRSARGDEWYSLRPVCGGYAWAIGDGPAAIMAPAFTPRSEYPPNALMIRAHSRQIQRKENTKKYRNTLAPGLTFWRSPAAGLLPNSSDPTKPNQYGRL